MINKILPPIQMVQLWKKKPGSKIQSAKWFIISICAIPKVFFAEYTLMKHWTFGTLSMYMLQLEHWIYIDRGRPVGVSDLDWDNETLFFSIGKIVFIKWKLGYRWFVGLGQWNTFQSEWLSLFYENLVWHDCSLFRFFMMHLACWSEKFLSLWMTENS